MLAGLGLAKALRVKNLKVFSDSQLVVMQVTDKYEAKEEKMVKYLRMVKAMMTTFEECQVQHIPRDQNTKADALSKLASAEIEDYQGTVYLETLGRPSISAVLVAPIGMDSTWMDPIRAYLEQGLLPQNPDEARKLRVRAARYVLIDDALYKRSFTLPYLRCLTPIEADYALREVHEGICGQHLGGRALAYKVMRQGYYWPNMQKEAIDFVKRCDKCQKHAPILHQPAEMISPITSPLPFATWGMDIVGPFPVASGQRKFVVVAIDYFTKWVEAEALATITEQKIQKFFWESVVCRYGIPRVLITDNGKQFDNPKFRNFCEELGIKQRFASVKHPQANGQVEVTNRTILDGLRKRLDEAKGAWAEELYNILWAYRTTSKSATGETPFNLAYGTEAVIPVEIGMPSYRVQGFNEQANEQGLRAGLDLLDEVKDEAQVRMAEYQRRTAKFYNLRVKGRSFKQGDLVLRKTEASDPRAASGKLSANWEGPYKVKKVLRPGAYQLETLEGNLVPRSWHAVNLRAYYQ